MDKLASAGRMLIFNVVVAALGGFLFGYDTAVISGCEQQIQKIFGLSGFLHGAVASACVWGCVAGALLGGRLTDAVGRKASLFSCAVMYFVTALTSGFAFGPWDLMASRFFGGVAVGVSSIAAPVYIAEISPPERRGTLGGLFQINIIVGMIASQLANWGIESLHLGDATWRWMLGAMVVPAAVFMALVPFIKESESWKRMKSAPPAMKTERVGGLFSRQNFMLLFLAVSISAYDQLSGINAVMYFAVRIFQMAGCAESTALAVTACMSAISCIGTVLGLVLIDRIGRRKLIITGLSGCVLAHFGCAAGFASNAGFLASACVFVFVVFYQLGQGVVLWVFLSELFPTRLRSQGQSTGIFVNWVCAAALTMVLPIFFERCPPWMIFSFFGVCLVTMIFWAVFLMPETKGKELE
jgi:MFS family permease